MSTSGTLEETAWDRVRRWRPTRRGVLVVGLLLVALVVLVAVAPARTGYLDPRAVDPSGSRALATLLADQGVEVADVRSTADAVRAAPGATVLVTEAILPTTRAVDDVLAAEPRRVVLVGAMPGMPAFDRLAAGVEIAGDTAEDDPLEPRCELREAVRAGAARLPGLRYDARAWVGGSAPRAAACYDDAASAAVVVLPARPGRPEVVLLGSPEPLTNAGLDEQGNAALAMNLLGTRDRLAWWRPTATDPALAGAEPTSLTELLPDWVRPVLVQLLIATALVAWWRGRRLGPLVIEPLPVVVRASETTVGRANLLHAQHARDEAAAHLRAASCEALRIRLGLALGCPPRHLVAAAAQRTGRVAPQVADLLYGPAPTDDAALVRLGHDLDELTAAVTAGERGPR